MTPKISPNFGESIFADLGSLLVLNLAEIFTAFGWVILFNLLILSLFSLELDHFILFFEM